MFCIHCGKEIPDNSRFCVYCGAQIFGLGSEAGCQISPGFSDRVNPQEILAAMKKNRKAAKIFMIFLVPLPLIGFIIYSLVSGEMEVKKALLYGGIVSLIFLIFAVISLVRGKTEKGYDAVVTGKSSRLVYRHKNNAESQERITEYYTTIRTDDGKKRTITEREGSRILAYYYLQEGDRFRYHPQFAFPYELYDKSKASCIYCVGCGTKNAVRDDRCKKCKLPLLK